MKIQDIRSLADLVHHKAEFLANTGSDIDHDTIAGMLTDVRADVDPDEMEEDDLLSAWFDALVDRFTGSETIEIHRHLTVPDWNGFIASIKAGATLGAHWSTDPHILSSVYGGHSVEVRMTGSTDAANLCWFSTFQQNFAHPDEQEVFVTGDVMLAVVADLGSDEQWRPDEPLRCTADPYVEDEGPAIHDAKAPAPFQPHR